MNNGFPLGHLQVTARPQGLLPLVLCKDASYSTALHAGFVAQKHVLFGLVFRRMLGDGAALASEQSHGKTKKGRSSKSAQVLPGMGVREGEELTSAMQLSL
jgi:hypothetical protein